MRICAACNKSKADDRFKLRNIKTGNRSPKCYECVYAAAKGARLDEYQRQYRKNNAELIRHQGYLRRYGVGIEWYQETLRKQSGCCAVCGADNPRRTNVKYFAVDHDHATGKPRGLICSPCNVGIGMLQDSVEILHQAIDYLERWSKHDEDH